LDVPVGDHADVLLPGLITFRGPSTGARTTRLCEPLLERAVRAGAITGHMNGGWSGCAEGQHLIGRHLTCKLACGKIRRIQVAAQLEFAIRTWGGRRRGAGRPRSPGRGAVAHCRREPHESRCPVHVTLRACEGVPSLRGARSFVAMRAALRAASRDGFRVVQFSIQDDHVHLIAEADTPKAWRSGIQGLAIRLARRLNAALRRRGTVWGDRYHARALRTPREVRNAIVYVLHNWKKHLRAVAGLDPCSSAAWFTGWRVATGVASGPSPPVTRSRTWLGAVGWRRLGLIDPDERPRMPRH
jgi:REP-associated tyrosine transposase